MTQPRDDWHKPRTRADRLSREDKQKLEEAFKGGVSYRDAARQLQCSSRTACKYFASFRRHTEREGEAPRKPKARLFTPAPAKQTSRFYKWNFEL